MGMTINTDKTKVMIIKSKDTYTNFVYDNNNLEEVSSYKYLGIDIHHNLNWNYSIEKRINGGVSIGIEPIGWEEKGSLPGNSRTALECASGPAQSERDLSLVFKFTSCRIFDQERSGDQTPKWNEVH